LPSQSLNVPLSKIYGVLTFYHLFKLEKPGMFPIQVCMGTACYLKGGQDIIQELENLLDIEGDSTSADGLFSIEAVRCIGCCGLAPVITIKGEVFGKVKREELPDIIAKFRNQ